MQPAATKRLVTGKVGDEWKIAVTAPPVDGKANQACVEFLAELCGVAKSSVKLVAGASSRRKAFEVAELTPEEIERFFEKARSGRQAT